MPNDELPDPDEGWRLKTYGRGVAIRVGRELLGGPLDGAPATWAPHFATICVPEGVAIHGLVRPTLHPYERREFVRDPEAANLPYKQVAVFWCQPGLDDDALETLAAERWP